MTETQPYSVGSTSNVSANGPQLMRVSNLTVHFEGKQNTRALEAANLTIGYGKVVGLIGESGAGKTTLGLAMLGLLPRTARISAGTFHWQGNEIDASNRPALAALRGRHITMILQDARSSLNPVYTVGEQLTWRVQRRNVEGNDQTRAFALNLLRQVQFSEPEHILGKYPHELSGGMCQRVMIAMALIQNPELLIADEPTTGLDVINQSAILNLLRTFSKKTAVLLITHDLAAVSVICDSIALLHERQVIDQSAVSDFFEKPKTAYGRALIDALPRVQSLSSSK